MAGEVDVTPLLRQTLYERSRVNDVESPPLSPELCTQPVPRALAGVIVYVEVRSIDSRENRSSAIASQVEALGATVFTKFTKDVTHVVFKDGKISVKERAQKSKVYLVSPLWVEACKRANDWISEAKYPVITRDTTDASTTPVVLGKIKRIKSMQPKPLEEEIAKSLERSRKRPQAVRSEGREKRQREESEDMRPFLNMDTEEDSGTSLDLPPINLPPTPRHPLAEKTENAVTPFLISSTIAGKLSAKPPHQPHNGTHNEINTAINNRDNSGVKESGSKVVAKGGLSKQTGSKVATKATKGNKTNSSKVQRSKGTFTAVKCTVVAGQRGKAGSRSKKVLPNKTAAKKAKKKAVAEKSAAETDSETDSVTATESAEAQSKSPSSVGKKKRRVNTSRNFSRELPGLVMTSVHTGDQDVVMSVVKRLRRFAISTSVDELTSHVVCGNARRTINILTATVRGCWILSLDWVWKSLEAGKWLPEEPFEMIDSFPAAQCFRQERAVAGSLCRPTFFRECGSVCVCPSTTPPALQLEVLLTAGGANVTRSLRKADVCVGCHSLREMEGEQGAVGVTEAWILDSISAHRVLQYDSYLLDKPESRATSPEL